MSNPVAGFKRPRPSYLGEALEALEEVQNLPPSDVGSNETNDEILHSLYTRAVALGEVTGQQDQLPALEAAYAARSARSIEDIEAAGITTDAASMTVLVQSIANGIGNDPRRQPPVACEPGSLWAWTKYFQNVGQVDGQDSQGSQGSSSGGVRLTKRLRMEIGESSTSGAANSRRFDLLSSVASCPDLLFMICANLHPVDIFVLYRVSRVFKATIDADLPSNSARLARLYAPESLVVFPWALYSAKASQSGQPTSPPTLRYLSMLVSRERKVRDIIACLARAGHRLPQPGASLTLKKMWLLFDTATNRTRHAMLRQLFTDDDLLTMQMFCTKLVLHLHEPLFSAASIVAPDFEAMDINLFNNTESTAVFAHVLLGQRSGFDPLWQLLRGRALTTARETVELKVRYDYLPPIMPALDMLTASQERAVRRRAAMEMGLAGDQADMPGAPGVPPIDFMDMDDGGIYPRMVPDLPHRDRTPITSIVSAIHAVPLWEMGCGCLEGWGLGAQYLMRPDQLIPYEAARRGLDLSSHMPYMAVWGARDFKTGLNLVPTIEELYISDEEEAGDVESAGESSTGLSKQPDHGEGERPASSPDALAGLLQEHRRDLEAAEERMHRLCGNVPCAPGEWQPWQVLKAQWPELALQQKVDIWWMCQQERLKLQAWMVEGEGDDDDEDVEVAEVQSASDDTEPGEETPPHHAGEGHATSIQPTPEAGQEVPAVDDVMRDLDELDHLDGYDSDGDSDLFVLDDRPPWETLNGGASSSGIAYPRLLHQRHRRHRRHQGSASQAARAYPPSGPQGLASVTATSVFSTFPTLAPAASPGLLTPELSDHAPLRVSSNGTTFTSSRSFSLRHRRLMAACVQTALQQQAAADAELVAQADDSYEEEELEWWEQQVEEMAGNGGGNTETNSGTTSPATSTAESTESHVGIGIANEDDTAIRPELVQIRHYGGEEDVVELLELLANAEAATAAAATGTIATADGGDGLAAEVEHLQAQLDRRLKAEVFAVDLSEM